MGREMKGSFKREGYMYTYGTEVWQTTAKFCKAIILQWKINIFFKKWKKKKKENGTERQFTSMPRTVSIVMSHRPESEPNAVNIQQNVPSYFKLYYSTNRIRPDLEIVLKSHHPHNPPKHVKCASTAPLYWCYFTVFLTKPSSFYCFSNQ